VAVGDDRHDSVKDRMDPSLALPERERGEVVKG
jgi:hypothetical protein